EVSHHQAANPPANRREWTRHTRRTARHEVAFSASVGEAGLSSPMTCLHNGGATPMPCSSPAILRVSAAPPRSRLPAPLLERLMRVATGLLLLLPQPEELAL